uniref:Fructose-bisphosphatase n=1 Tax=Globodera pallida TaxID=36090 RepID=A0A183BK22_GLOPA
MANQYECSDIASSSIGKPIRVDFVKESKKLFVFGNLLSKDPESGSIVLAQFYGLDVAEAGNTVSTYEHRNRIQRVILIPGSSVQSVQVLEEDGNEQVVGTVTGDGRICGAVKNTAKLREKIEGMFWTYGETADGSNGKRTLSETLRIFDEYAQSRRHRLIDALNKIGIKFSETPHVLTQTVGEESVLKKGSTTLIVVKGGMTIYPPYGKNDIFGAAIATKELVCRLTAENVFEDCCKNSCSTNG